MVGKFAMRTLYRIGEGIPYGNRDTICRLATNRTKNACAFLPIFYASQKDGFVSIYETNKKRETPFGVSLFLLVNQYVVKSNYID